MTCVQQITAQLTPFVQTVVLHILPQHKTTFFQNHANTPFISLSLFNASPTCIKKQLDPVDFKKSLKDYLTENKYHNSVEDYLEVFKE